MVNDKFNELALLYIHRYIIVSIAGYIWKLM